MEESREIDTDLEETTESVLEDFYREEFSIQIEETEDGKQTFYVKSEEFFQKLISH